MKGRDLILYILQNGLENEDVFKDGKLLGFMTMEEAAVKFEVGISTISVWIATGQLQAIKIVDTVLIPELSQNPKERIQNEKDIASVYPMDIGVCNSITRTCVVKSNRETFRNRRL